MNGWQELKKQDFNKFVEEYKKFMYNEGNVHKCDGCPENEGRPGNACGQQNCWVAVHCGRY